MNEINDSEIEIFSLNEKRNRQIDEAFISNKDKVKKIGGAATPNLASFMKDQVENSKGYDNKFNSLEDVESEEVKQTIEKAFLSSEALFSRIDLIPPTPEQYMLAGVDFIRLADEYERMEREKLEPAIVISPVLALDNSPNTDGEPSAKCWGDLFVNLIKDYKIHDNPLETNPYFKSKGFLLSTVLKLGLNSEFLFNQEIGFVTNNKKIHKCSPKSDNIVWTISLVPGTETPQELGSFHTDHEDPDNRIDSEQITISQYLAMQSFRIQSEKEPIDNDTCTWSQGELSKILMGNCLSWNKGIRSLYIDYKRVNVPDPKIGVRLPFWG